ncbi:hypothetical protein GCM10009862_09230 [Microbacterium binotii]|uniref:Uncharacterized protein n=1 Tax=Microbacterium binotii TaxID=462710 RepID=A0ABN3P7A9_9MICO
MTAAPEEMHGVAQISLSRSIDTPEMTTSRGEACVPAGQAVSSNGAGMLSRSVGSRDVSVMLTVYAAPGRPAHS